MAIWLLLGTLGRADSLVTTIVNDPITGVAIDGYDPVSYFIDSDPQPGKPDFEYDWQGVPWYFESAANRDVFMRNPGVYAPQYGGHCVTALSRGYLSDGKAQLFVIDALKLYLFYSTANRDAFLLSKSDVMKSAAANWPKLAATLMGPKDAQSVVSGASSIEASSSAASPAGEGPAGASDAEASFSASAAAPASSEAAGSSANQTP